jgi:hypothetical protein
MDTVLLTVTILSLAMAVAMAFIVAKLMRDERARSEARVNALTAMAAQPAADVPIAAPLAAAALSARLVATNSLSAAEALDGRSRIADARQAPKGTRLEDLDLRPEPETVAGVSHLFEEAAAPSPWGRRFVVIGALVAIMATMGIAIWMKSGAATSTPPSTIAAAPQQPAVPAGAPLELVSLHHRQEAQRLVITGLVQNPRTSGAISHVVATAFLFGPDGGFLTSSRAPLDFTTLAPGDESAFLVSVPVTQPVARYRIGFRTEDGRVIEHVDKRAPDALAQK